MTDSGRAQHDGLSYPNRAPETTPHVEERHDHGAHRGHGLMMLACCIPMIVIVALLVATGAAGSGAVLWAIGCVVLMAVMHLAMPGGHNHR